MWIAKVAQLGLIGIAATLTSAASGGGLGDASWIQPDQPYTFSRSDGASGVARIRVNVPDLRRRAAQGERFLVEHVPLPGVAPVTLELERFRVLDPSARVVLGTADGDMPVDFDLKRILFLRGTVAGRPGSHVVLSLGERSSIGRIELGAGAQSFVLTSRVIGEDLGPDEIAVFEARGGTGLPLECATVGESHDDDGVGPAGPQPVLGMRQGELAIDGDYELFTMFETSDDALEYMVQLYGAVSAITMRDVRVRLDIVFIRLWTTPDDPYGDTAGFPQIPGGVEHDVSQLISGARIGTGAVAEGICATRSLVAYSLGGIVDPSSPNVDNQDIVLCAHELGHCLGARHTHEMGFDRCDSPATSTKRGPIMAYCYYFSGGYANTDLRYYTTNKVRIESCVGRRAGFVDDCNQNGIDDTIDIADGTSQDVNANGIPDECEDCNANGRLDDEDIALGFSDDVNENGVPDECEPDCNANGVPDEMDIRTGFSEDLYGNGVPDECEADCNANGISDYAEIQADMTLDIDRNAVLDGCEDCDSDGVADIIELDGANAVWVISTLDGLIREYHPVTGVLMRSGDAGHLDDPQDVLITPDARILVSSAGLDDGVIEFDRSGAFVRVLVAPGAGGLENPGAMLAVGDGTLLISGRSSNNVLRFDIESGQFLEEFVSAGAGGLVDPYGLAIGPTGSLLVGTGDDRVLEYDGATGEFVRELVGAGAGGLGGARDLLVLEDGRLLITSETLGAILAYDAATGAFLGQFNYGSFEDGLAGAWGLGLGSDGSVHASGSSRGDFHLTDPRMMTFDPSNGYSIRAFIQRPDSQLRNPRGFDFMPPDGDCNRNLIPDACDIDQGRSQDANGNGVPDECEDLCPADLDGDGDADSEDFFAYLDAFAAGNADICDIDIDGDCDSDDFFGYLELFAQGC